MTSQQQINDLKNRARYLRSRAAKAKSQGLLTHAETLDSRAAELERLARDYENRQK